MLDSGFYNMDCMTGMKEFPDKFFDLAIVDPPYGDAGKNKGKYNRFGGWFDRYKSVERSGAQCAQKYGRKIVSWDVAPGAEYFEELRRVSKNQIIWGGNYFPLPPTRCFVVWRKTQIANNFSMGPVEYAWTSFDRNAQIFDFVSLAQKGRFHPTQKPVELYAWMLGRFSEPGQKILDTHVGSAPSLIACHRNRNPFWGFEIDPEYYKQAKERLDDELAQMTVFDFLGG